MKTLAAVLFFAAFGLHAQVPVGDSLAREAQTRLDSLSSPWQNRFDSLRTLGRLQHLKDSITALSWGDSLRTRVKAQFATRQQKIQRTIDSLRARKLSTRAYQQKLDSLNQKQKSLLGEVDAKQKQLQQQIDARYRKWQSKLDSAGVKLPGINLPGAQLPGTPALPNTDFINQLNVPELPALNTSDFVNLNLSTDLQQIGGDLSVPSASNLTQWATKLAETGPLSEWTGQLNQANAAWKDPAKAAEQAVTNVDAVQDATKQLGDAQKQFTENEALELAEKMKDPEAMKEEVIEQVQQQAMDHFAGKQEVLQQAMDNMSKYKRKFSSLESLDKLPKHPNRPRNGLKGQAFRERFRLGLAVGVQNQTDTLNLDFFPQASYHITGRLEAGLGMSYRVRLEKDVWHFHQQQAQWGFMSFATVKAFKGVRWRLETDVTSIPQPGVPTERGPAREWRWTWLTGVQTTFNISERFTGNVQMLYNFDRKITDGFPEFLVLRVGVQYKFKARTKMQSE